MIKKLVNKIIDILAVNVVMAITLLGAYGALKIVCALLKISVAKLIFMFVSAFIISALAIRGKEVMLKYIAGGK